MEETFNQCEAVLWFVLAVVVAVGSRRQPPALRRNACLACVALVVFGVSDLIEARTGAWWRPWWLFVMKAACVLALAACLRRHVRLKRGHG